MKAFRLEIVDGLVATTYTKKRKSSGSAGPSVKVSKHKPHTPEVRKCEQHTNYSEERKGVLCAAQKQNKLELIGNAVSVKSLCVWENKRATFKTIISEVD